MENSAQTPITNETSKNPKPGDQVQLDIETVTPETEKEVAPNQNTQPAKTAEQPKDEETSKEPAEEQPKVQADEEPKPASDAGKSGDAREQVETVSP